MTSREAGVNAPILVAIDGPAGSGKSSVSRTAAEQLGFGILDTGAAYRALTWAALDGGVDLDDAALVEAVLRGWEFSISLRGAQVVTVNGTDVTGKIREPRITERVSRVSKHPRVRDELNAMFIDIVAASALPGVVIEGRDITTVVAPDAPVRILLTASPEVRAQRRLGELSGVTQEEVLADLQRRDAKDAEVVDFFTPAEGVTLIDTSDLDFEAAVAAVTDVIEAVRVKGTP